MNVTAYAEGSRTAANLLVAGPEGQDSHRYPGRRRTVQQTIVAHRRRHSPYDLFPETFQTDGLQCEKADLETELPITTGSADVVLCQEGIEHVGNQVGAFREFTRILKPGGRLILSTPNQSNLKYKASFLLLESEAFRRMPPNEIDSVEVREARNRFGHVFLIGIQQLRLFAKLAGFHLKKIHYCGTSPAALTLYLMLSPVIFAIITKTFLQTMARRRRHPSRHVYRELYTLAVDPHILIGRHLLVEFEKREPVFFSSQEYLDSDSTVASP